MAEPEPTGLKGKNRREGQVISSEGDKQRCTQLFTATVEDLKGRMAPLMEAMEENGERARFIEYRGSYACRVCLRSGTDGVGPRMYERVVWEREVRRTCRLVYSWYAKWSPWWAPSLRRMLSHWVQMRMTVGAIIEVELIDEDLPYNVRSVSRWTGYLTVAADGVVEFSDSESPLEFSGVPATEDSLREWINRWKAEMPAEVRTAQRELEERRKLAQQKEEAEKKKEEAEKKARRLALEKAAASRWLDIRRDALRSSGVDGSIGIASCDSQHAYALSHTKLKQAMALVRDEIALRRQEDPQGPRSHEPATIEGPKMIRWTHWGRERRMYYETLMGYGDPDDDRSRWTETKTVGCLWQYGGISAVMTVSMDGVVEIDSGGVTATATSDDLRAILGRPQARRPTAAGDRPDREIEQVRRDKEAAIDSQDYETAARLREEEKRLLKARDARKKARAQGTPLAQELGQLTAEVDPLRTLLREHGIDPGDDTPGDAASGEAPGDASAPNPGEATGG